MSADVGLHDDFLPKGHFFFIGQLVKFVSFESVIFVAIWVVPAARAAVPFGACHGFANCSRAGYLAWCLRCFGAIFLLTGCFPSISLAIHLFAIVVAVGLLWLALLPGIAVVAFCWLLLNYTPWVCTEVFAWLLICRFFRTRDFSNIVSTRRILFTLFCLITIHLVLCLIRVFISCW